MQEKKIKHISQNVKLLIIYYKWWHYEFSPINEHKGLLRRSTGGLAGLGLQRVYVYLDVCFQHVLVCVQSSAEAEPYGNTVEAFCTSSHLLLFPLLILPQGGRGREEGGEDVHRTSKEL